MSVKHLVNIGLIRKELNELELSLQTIDKYGYASDNPDTRIEAEKIYKLAKAHIEYARKHFDRLCEIAEDNFGN